MRKISCAVAVVLSVVASFGRTVSAYAAEIKIIASPSLSAVMEDISPRFEQATGNKVVASYGLITPMRRHIENGEPFDVAIVPAALMAVVGQQGKFESGSIAEIARISLGVAVRARGAKPDIASVEAFKRTMLAAQSVAYIPNEPTGIHVAKTFERLGIAAQMKDKTKPQHSLAGVVQAVANGEAEFGFAVISNIVSESDVDLVGRMPSELQYQIVLMAGIARATTESAGAKAFMKYLATPAVAAAFKARGLDSAAQ